MVLTQENLHGANLGNPICVDLTLTHKISLPMQRGKQLKKAFLLVTTDDHVWHLSHPHFPCLPVMAVTDDKTMWNTEGEKVNFRSPCSQIDFPSYYLTPFWIPPRISWDVRVRFQFCQQHICFSLSTEEIKYRLETTHWLCPIGPYKPGQKQNQ